VLDFHFPHVIEPIVLTKHLLDVLIVSFPLILRFASIALRMEITKVTSHSFNGVKISFVIVALPLLNHLDIVGAILRLHNKHFRLMIWKF
jgi:hypothetical protein